MTPAERSRMLRFKRPALASMGHSAIWAELEDISEKCSEIRWWMDTDDDTLLNALDGDEEDAWEFKMAFADLECKCERLLEQFAGWQSPDEQTFDDCTVALIGNCYNLVGFDDYEEDYFALTSYQERLAEEEAGKRLMRKTKKEIISTIGQCVSTLLAYYDIRQRYDYLQAEFDILRNQNTALLDTIKEIEHLYDEAQSSGEWSINVRKFNTLLDALPQELWVS